jgi:hypothetical protein
VNHSYEGVLVDQAEPGRIPPLRGLFKENIFQVACHEVEESPAMTPRCQAKDWLRLPAAQLGMLGFNVETWR